MIFFVISWKTLIKSHWYDLIDSFSLCFLNERGRIEPWTWYFCWFSWILTHAKFRFQLINFILCLSFEAMLARHPMKSSYFPCALERIFEIITKLNSVHLQIRVNSESENLFAATKSIIVTWGNGWWTSLPDGICIFPFLGKHHFRLNFSEYFGLVRSTFTFSIEKRRKTINVYCRWTFVCIA